MGKKRGRKNSPPGNVLRSPRPTCAYAGEKNKNRSIFEIESGFPDPSLFGSGRRVKVKGPFRMWEGRRENSRPQM